MIASEAISNLTHIDISNYFARAKESSRDRFPLILHKKGDFENKVINFLGLNSYMHPHLHPGQEKIESIYLIQGKCAIIYFNDSGLIDDVKVLNKPNQFIRVPAFKWHTYVMLSDNVITYETMDGIYNSDSWKLFADWAPIESSAVAKDYLQMLKKAVSNFK